MEAPRLRLVSDNSLNAIAPFPWPDDNGELLTTEQAVERVKSLLYENEGLTKLTKKQARENARLNSTLAKIADEDADTKNHPKGAVIVGLLKRWSVVCNHPNSDLSDGKRIKLVKARLNAFNEEQLELAEDGAAAFPYRVYGNRLKTGRPEDRKDQISDIFGDAERVETLANLGWKARQGGWTPEEGWPA